MSNFVQAQGLKTVHARGWGVKKWINSVHVVVECLSSAKNDHGEEIFSSKAHFVIDSTKV